MAGTRPDRAGTAVGTLVGLADLLFLAGPLVRAVARLTPFAGASVGSPPLVVAGVAVVAGAVTLAAEAVRRRGS